MSTSPRRHPVHTIHYKTIKVFRCMYVALKKGQYVLTCPLLVLNSKLYR